MASSFPPTTDPDGISFFELRRYTSNLALTSGAARDVVFNQIVGDQVTNRVVSSTGISVKPREARRYRLTARLEVINATTTPTVCTLTLVTSGGRTFVLDKTSIPSSASGSIIMGGSVILPFGVVTGAKETAKLQLNPATQNIEVVYGSATNRTSYLQVEEFPGYPSDPMSDVIA